VADVSEAAAALTNFNLLREREHDPAERNKLLRVIFESVSQDSGQLVAVTPREAFLPYSQWGQESEGKYGSDGTRTRDLRRDRPSRAH
jgi:hypothetical protein